MLLWQSRGGCYPALCGGVILHVCATRNAQVAAGLLSCCHQADISECVRIAYCGFMKTSLLQVVNQDVLYNLTQLDEANRLDTT